VGFPAELSHRGSTEAGAFGHDLAL